jgi:hypothetical protein
MAQGTYDPNQTPLFACLTGFELPAETFELGRGLLLRRSYVDIFSTTMMAFSPPTTPSAHHPGPWVPVQAGFSFNSRVELSLTEEGVLDGFAPVSTAWFAVALLRLCVEAPVRMAVLGNMPFSEMRINPDNARAIGLETTPNHVGLFRAGLTEVPEAALNLTRDLLPAAARLYHAERFYRAFTLKDVAAWSPNTEQAMTLIWSALEILFDVGSVTDEPRQ